MGFTGRNQANERRYRCSECGETFSSTRGTPYYRLKHRRTTFDEVAYLSVEGVNKSAIYRVKGIAWNTVSRWLEKPAHFCRRFNDQMISGLEMSELQADELRTFVGRKEKQTWVFTAIEVWSRLWPSTIVGRRSYRNTLRLMRDTAARLNWRCCPLIVTDGFEFYPRVARQVFGPACLYAQVLKTRRNDRITTVKRRQVIGTAIGFAEALLRSEDSSTLNTSFVERLNLTIRQASAYLTRRTTCHARVQVHLEDQLGIVRCHYNFIRPHRALKFAAETRTPAMQAGLTRKRLSFRDVFTWALVPVSAGEIVYVFGLAGGRRADAA